MSSTNRSNARDNHISDYYVTPYKPIFDLFDKMNNQIELQSLFINNFLNHKIYCDPCAGGDDKNEMSYPYVLKELGLSNNNIITIDIRNDSKAKIKDNFLTMDNNQLKNIDVIITNPPFNIAQEIIEKSLSIIKPNGFVIMLLRLNFFGSKQRRNFWLNNMPIFTFVHHQRISFTKGQTDSIEYMHCVWQKDIVQDYTKLIII